MTTRQTVNVYIVKEFTKKDNSGSHKQLVTPVVHDTLSSGHLGRKRTHEKVTRNFFWV